MTKSKWEHGLLPIAVVSVVMAVALGAPTECVLQTKPVRVNLDNTVNDGTPKRHIETLRHSWDAREDGQPDILHIARDEAEANRDASIGRLKDEDPTTDADEYPPAMSDEGGIGADVRFINSSDNRSAGSTMGHQLRKYCNNQAFYIERKPEPKSQ